MDFAARDDHYYRAEEHDFADVVPDYLTRIDMPDGRTRLHSTLRSEPHDIRDEYRYEVHRVIDRIARTTILDLWRLDCESNAEWRDGALDLRVQPGDLCLRIDPARGEYRVGGDATWLPIAQLQEHVDREIGTGFGFAIEEERREAEYQAAAPERAEANRRERRKGNRDLILCGLFFLALFLLWYLDPTGAFEN